ncbi:hypothetical protein JY494_04300 [Serratia marcescens]|nr:hypothetical protein [Serratia marcescens]
MTQTLTTERLKDLTFHRSKLIFPASHEEAAAMARELLANREAQPVGFISAKHGPVLYGEHIGLPAGTHFYTAPPAPAATTTVSLSENSDADMCREWAWKQVKEMITPDGWTVGDNITYFGFFCWGWDMRRQYNEQRPPAPAVPDAVNVLLTHIEDALPDSAWKLIDVKKWNAVSMLTCDSACRAAMLAQPVSQGYKLVPVEPTEEMIAAAMNCDDVEFNSDETFCVNFDNIYRAMLAAAPEGGNG